jgi:hypothetical protein
MDCGPQSAAGTGPQNFLARTAPGGGASQFLARSARDGNSFCPQACGLVVGRYIGNSIYRVDIWYIVSYRYRGHFIGKFDIFFT